MQTRILSWAFLALFASTGTLLIAQPDDSALRIKTVEGGLVPSVSVSGSPAVQRTIQDRMRTYHVPGVSIAVIQNYRIDWAKGYGAADPSTKALVGTETRFQAGSISKPVAAAGALKLVEEGKLSLDEDVNQKLRSWKVPENSFTSDSHAVQTVQTPGGLYGAPAYWNGHLYYFGADDVLSDFALTAGRLSPKPVHQGDLRFRNPGAIPVVSANGVRDGIVWVVRTKMAGEHDVEAVLEAYDASDVSHLLYNSEESKDNPGLALRLTMPMIANGRVYVASHDSIYVYALKN